ncbi:MAG: CoA-binding protein [Gammaproteobacteria bacterium]|nr:CoA-binding protein [Gammaproteobacteria bacterium]
MRKALSEATTIAVVGASDKSHRASHGVMRFLQEKGYRCIPVSPRLAGQTLLGETVYATLADIPDAVDMVDLFVNSSLAGDVTDQAIDIGANTVWMQLGVVDEAAAARARDAGLTVVMDRCPAQEWAGLQLPSARG